MIVNPQRAIAHIRNFADFRFPLTGFAGSGALVPRSRRFGSISPHYPKTDPPPEQPLG